jgi:hypothetical protein
MGALKAHNLPKDDLKQVRRIFDDVEGRERYELNLYISGYDEDDSGTPVALGTPDDGMPSAPGDSSRGRV